MKFENLLVWQRSVKLSVELYKYFSTSKEFGFKDQITRCSLSVPSNVAEGCERYSEKEKLHFFRISKGSCGELVTQIYIGIEANLIDRECGARWISETREIAAMLGGVINHLTKTSD